MSHSSNTTPSGKPSLFATRQALMRLSNKKADEQMGLRSIAQPLSQGYYFGPEIYRLACQVAGVESMKDRDILLTFMDEEAWDIMMKMPNPFWFWEVFRHAAIASESEDELRFGRREVLFAIDVVRSSLSYKYKLSQRLADLPADDGRREHRIASRAAVGLVLVVLGLFESDTMIDNPLFFDNF